jgi:hypothetical protein
VSDLLTLLLIVIFVIFGYRYPNSSGWFVAFIVLLLGPTELTLVPGSFLPLTIYRAGFAIVLGMVIRLRKPIKSDALYKSNFVIHFIIFTCYLALISAGDAARPTFFTDLPKAFIIVFLPAIIIKDLNSLKKLVSIYALIAVVVSISVILEYYTPINLSYMIEKTLTKRPGIQYYSQTRDGLNTLMRLDRYRPGGLWRNSLDTAYLLSFLFPLTIWKAISAKTLTRRLVHTIFPIITVVALVLLQTRTALVAVVIGIGIFIIMSMLVKNVHFRKNVRKLVIWSAVLFLFVTIVDSSLVINSFSSTIELYQTTIESSGDLSLDPRFDWIDIAIGYFYDRPFFGHMISPNKAYFDIMHAQDLPAIFIYLISGGVLLAGIYISLLFRMPIKVFRIIMQKANTDKTIFVLITISLISSIAVLFSNKVESHLMMTFILFISVYKLSFISALKKSDH